MYIYIAGPCHGFGSKYSSNVTMVKGKGERGPLTFVLVQISKDIVFRNKNAITSFTIYIFTHVLHLIWCLFIFSSPTIPMDSYLVIYCLVCRFSHLSLARVAACSSMPTHF